MTRENNCLGMTLKCKFMLLFRIFSPPTNLILRKVKTTKKFHSSAVSLGHDLKYKDVKYFFRDCTRKCIRIAEFGPENRRNLLAFHHQCVSSRRKCVSLYNNLQKASVTDDYQHVHRYTVCDRHFARVNCYASHSWIFDYGPLAIRWIGLSNSGIQYSPPGFPIASNHNYNSVESKLERGSSTFLQKNFYEAENFAHYYRYQPLHSCHNGNSGYFTLLALCVPPSKSHLRYDFPVHRTQSSLHDYLQYFLRRFPRCCHSCVLRASFTHNSHSPPRIRNRARRTRFKIDFKPRRSQTIQDCFHHHFRVFVMLDTMCNYRYCRYHTNEVVSPRSLYVLHIFSLHQCSFKPLDIWFYEQNGSKRDVSFINVMQNSFLKVKMFSCNLFKIWKFFYAFMHVQQFLNLNLRNYINILMAI